MHFQHLDFPTACMSTDICCPGEIRRVAEALKMLQAFVAEKTRCWLASIRAVVFGEFRVLVLEAVVKGPGLVVFISGQLKLRSFYSFNQFTQFTNFTQFTRFTHFALKYRSVPLYFPSNLLERRSIGVKASPAQTEKLAQVHLEESLHLWPETIHLLNGHQNSWQMDVRTKKKYGH